MIVSLVVTTYNVSKYVEECVNSILNQLTDECELIIVDDCSTDNTVKIIRKCIDHIDNRYKTITLIARDKNGGVSSSRNIGLTHAMGDYVAFVDGDDYISNTYIRDVIYTVKLTHKDYYLIGWRGFGFKNETYLANRLPKWNTSVWSRIFNIDIIKHMFNENIEWAEDKQFLEENIKSEMSVGYVMNTIYFYRWGRLGCLTNKYKKR